MAKKQLSTVPTPLTVEIGGTTYDLKCSRNARKVIDNACGGIRPALEAVQNYNFDQLAAIVIAGSGVRMTAAKAESLADELWSEMDHDTIGKISEFVARMANGGRDPAADKETRSTDDEPDTGPEADQGGDKGNG